MDKRNFNKVQIGGIDEFTIKSNAKTFLFGIIINKLYPIIDFNLNRLGVLNGVDSTNSKDGMFSFWRIEARP